MMNKSANKRAAGIMTGTEIQSHFKPPNMYRKFEVDYDSCSLEINEPVTPQTVIGRHYQTGQEMRASANGKVATIYFNPMHNSLMIMIVDNSPEPSIAGAGQVGETMQCLVLVKFLEGGSLSSDEFFRRVGAQWSWVDYIPPGEAGDTGKETPGHLVKAREAICIADYESVEQLAIDLAIMPGAGISGVELIPIVGEMLLSSQQA
jgi:hypothetical protein